MVSAALFYTVSYPSPAFAHPSALLQSLRATAADITVRIEAEASGSGTLIARENSIYYVLTTKHLVAFEDNYQIVTPDGVSHAIETIAPLEGVDLALVTFTSQTNYNVAKFSTFPTASRQGIFLSGWPLSDQAPSSYVFLPGELVAAPHAALYSEDPVAMGYDLFYTNLTGAGLSGGPLLDASGRLMGIHGRSDGTRILDPTTQQDRRVLIGYSSGISVRTFINYASPALKRRLNVEHSPHQALSSQDLWDISSELGAQLNPLPPFPNAIDWLNRSNQLFRTRQFIPALQTVDQATQLAPDLMEAWYFRSILLYELGDFSSALTTSNLVVDLAPGFGLGWRQRGRILAELGRYADATDAFDRALQLNEQDYVVWYLKGELLERYYHDESAALAAYERAISLAPNFEIAQRARTLLLAEAVGRSR
ncbi:MAG: tetratricopeptide repeat-containing serine protease family protein [Cyanobacteria bacterium P01_A01_bin.105]